MMERGQFAATPTPVEKLPTANEEYENFDQENPLSSLHGIRTTSTASRTLCGQSLDKHRSIISEYAVSEPIPHKAWHARSLDWYSRWFVDWWALELLSWFLGVICIMTIVVVLWEVDGKRMPSWKLGISIDTLIAVLSGFTKSCLLMPTAEALGQLKWNWFRKERKMIDFEKLDNASKGTWGSLTLLASTRGV